MEVIKHGNTYKEVECPGCRALLSYCKGDIKTKFIEDEVFVSGKFNTGFIEDYYKRKGLK